MLIRSIGSICTATFRRMAANLYAILAPAATAGESSAARIEGVGDVLRHPAGRDQHDVEADVALNVVRVVG